jgi:hypothetical protein
MNSSEGHLSKKDVRSRTEMFVPVKNEPRKGGEVEITKVCAERVQRETREFRHSSSENFWEFNVHFRDIGIICDLEVLQLWRRCRKVSQQAFEGKGGTSNRQLLEAK